MKKVLVIEDSLDVHTLITDALSSKGYKVLAVEDGQAGVEAAQQHSPDLIICDLHMPVLDGFGTLAKLRDTPTTAAIPVIFLTGMADKPLMRRGMELGADDFLTKPFTLPELLGAVRTQLDKQAALVQRAEKKLEELRGNISLALPHELLTPISGILGFASILIDEHASMRSDEIAEAAQNIHSSALRLRRTIENFLLYSQIELVAANPARVSALRQGQHAHTREGLEAVARQVAVRFRREADLQTQIEPATLPISADQLEKLVYELLDNAFKFSRSGTRVSFSATVRNKEFTITVEDHGRGLTAEAIQNIGAHMQFERKLYEQQGSGLGLTIVRRLVELHGGNLEIESIPGQRTQVQVTIPTA